jgi:hypothetical protein
VTIYYAVTLFFQGDNVFEAATRQLELSSVPPKWEEVAEHLAGILNDNCNAQWGRDFEVPSRLEFGELTATEIAIRLAEPLSGLPVSNITYTILTRFSDYSLSNVKAGTVDRDEEEELFKLLRMRETQ